MKTTGKTQGIAADQQAGTVEIQVVYRPAKGKRIVVYATASPDVLMAMRVIMVESIVQQTIEAARIDPILPDLLRGDGLRVSGTLRAGAERNAAMNGLHLVKPRRDA